MKILVVDDEPDMRTMLEAVLSSSGHEVELASNGLEALAKIPDTMPDLILLDIHFPGYLSGIDICRRIKKNPDYASTEVIIMTADGDRENVVRAVRAGARECLAKPFEMNVLKKKIAAVFAN
ncbi:response regulator [bacterium]|nr:response regulator [bacterium]